MKLVEKARKHNDDFDRTDREHGGAAPIDCEFGEFLRVAISAVAAGLELLAKGKINNGTDCVAEGFCMIQDAELMVRKHTHHGI